MAERKPQRWVIKIGSSLLTNDGQGLNVPAINAWVEQMVDLLNQDVQVVLVSSGAVAEGMTRLGWRQRPHEIHRLQAAAAVGQMGLVQTYETAFQRHQLHTAQILLCHDDIGTRDRYLNARGALNSLLELKVVPVVNENDTVVTDEIRFGDNDTLAALVANLVDADLLVILTDQNGLYDADPRKNPAASLIQNAAVDDAVLDEAAGESAGQLGRGGMITKIRAARLAARSGTNTVIVGGREDQVLPRILAGESVGTYLSAKNEPLAARKQWLAGMLKTRGKLVLDDGAVSVLRNSGKSLLPIGVTEVVGDFKRGDLVSCVTANHVELARGLVNYNSDESRQIIGKSSKLIESSLGYQGEAEIMHRDNLVLV